MKPVACCRSRLPTPSQPGVQFGHPLGRQNAAQLRGRVLRWGGGGEPREAGPASWVGWVRVSGPGRRAEGRVTWCPGWASRFARSKKTPSVTLHGPDLRRRQAGRSPSSSEPPGRAHTSILQMRKLVEASGYKVMVWGLKPQPGGARVYGLKAELIVTCCCWAWLPGVGGGCCVGQQPLLSPVKVLHICVHTHRGAPWDRNAQLCLCSSPGPPTSPMRQGPAWVRAADGSPSLTCWQGSRSGPTEGPGRRLAVLETPQGGKVVSQEPGRVSGSPQPSRHGKEAGGASL